MLAMVNGEMEKAFDSRLHVQSISDKHVYSNPNRSNTFAFRAPQEKFTIHDFELGKIYGHGCKSKKEDTGKVYALKIMDKMFITKENKNAYVKLERIVLDQLDHPGIVRLYFTFQDRDSLYMAFESCEGGELF
ncbi:hypothetical protein L2E82_22660 [Cichorium intybus]|uniref:Uncharacterized protein n=1 Tax=Cichorium intybus TaxID=13427 RepID=A0ACB9DYT5_CICIN|nr:hypothetical protein L2E82_22660 [Cichorium intybus]